MSSDWNQMNELSLTEEYSHIASLSHTKALTLIGEEHALDIVNYLKRSNIDKTIIFLSFVEQGQRMSSWHTREATEAMPIVRVNVPPPSFADQTDMLLAAHQGMREVCLLVHMSPQQSCPWICDHDSMNGKLTA